MPPRPQHLTTRRAPQPPADQLSLDGYHLFHATRADLLRRLGRRDDAVAAYDAAIARTANGAERAFLTRQRDSL